LKNDDIVLLQIYTHALYERILKKIMRFLNLLLAFVMNHNADCTLQCERTLLLK